MALKNQDLIKDVPDLKICMCVILISLFTITYNNISI